MAQVPSEQLPTEHSEPDAQVVPLATGLATQAPLEQLFVLQSPPSVSQLRPSKELSQKRQVVPLKMLSPQGPATQPPAAPLAMEKSSIQTASEPEVSEPSLLYSSSTVTDPSGSVRTTSVQSTMPCQVVASTVPLMKRRSLSQQLSVLVLTQKRSSLFAAETVVVNRMREVALSAVEPERRAGVPSCPSAVSVVQRAPVTEVKAEASALSVKVSVVVPEPPQTPPPQKSVPPAQGVQSGTKVEPSQTPARQLPTAHSEPALQLVPLATGSGMQAPAVQLPAVQSPSTVSQDAPSGCGSQTTQEVPLKTLSPQPLSTQLEPAVVPRSRSSIQTVSLPASRLVSLV